MKRTIYIAISVVGIVYGATTFMTNVEFYEVDGVARTYAALGGLMAAMALVAFCDLVRRPR